MELELFKLWMEAKLVYLRDVAKIKDEELLSYIENWFFGWKGEEENYLLRKYHPACIGKTEGEVILFREMVRGDSFVDCYKASKNGVIAFDLGFYFYLPFIIKKFYDIDK